MSYFLNENSLHRQYGTSSDFRKALAIVMECKWQIEQFGHTIYCCDHLRSSEVTENSVFQVEVNALERSQKILVLRWFDQSNWSNSQSHNAIDDDYLYSGRTVNNTSVAEAVCRNYQAYQGDLVSFSPSELYNTTPLSVIWETPETSAIQINVENLWTREQVVVSLEQREANAKNRPVTNWRELIEWGYTYCSYLFFASDLLDRLNGVPFSLPVAKQIQQRLTVLNDLKRETNEDGSRTARGHELYQREFVGERAHFTDESESNKQTFHNELTFMHPEIPGQNLFCPWHGKVSTQFFRIHFSWPNRANSPLYIIYIVPKITKD